MAIFAFFISTLFIGIPIFIVLAGTAMFYLLITGNMDLFLSYIPQLHSGLSHFGLLAIPLFILVGEVMNEAGITRRLINVSKAVIGSVRSGLAFVNVIANGLMAAIIGSAVAQTAVMSRVMVPEMERNGYNRSIATAITCAGGMLGAIIPPSMPFIIFAVLSQVPVSEMFLAGVIPGLMLATLFLILTGILGFIHDFPFSEKLDRDKVVQALVVGIPSLSVPVCIVATILMGWGSPVDAAAIGIALSLLIGFFIHKELNVQKLSLVLERTARNSSMVLILVASASVFGWVITYQNIPQAIANIVSGLASSPVTFLLIVALFLMLIGTVLDGVAAMIIVVPVLQPIATGIYDIPSVQFGVIVVLTLVLGLITPPVGASLYVASGIAGVPPWRLFIAIMPYLLLATLLVVALCFFPGIINFWF